MCWTVGLTLIQIRLIGCSFICGRTCSPLQATLIPSLPPWICVFGALNRISIVISEVNLKTILPKKKHLGQNNYLFFTVFLTWWSKTESFVGRKQKYLFYHGFYLHKILKMDIYIKYWLGQTNGKISCKLWPKYFPIILGQDQHTEVRFVGKIFHLGRVLYWAEFCRYKYFRLDHLGHVLIFILINIHTYLLIFLFLNISKTFLK